jgi:hypothetical protein
MNDTTTANDGIVDLEPSDFERTMIGGTSAATRSAVPGRRRAHAGRPDHGNCGRR